MGTLLEVFNGDVGVLCLLPGPFASSLAPAQNQGAWELGSFGINKGGPPPLGRLARRLFRSVLRPLANARRGEGAHLPLRFGRHDRIMSRLRVPTGRRRFNCWIACLCDHSDVLVPGVHPPFLNGNSLADGLRNDPTESRSFTIDKASSGCAAPKLDAAIGESHKQARQIAATRVLLPNLAQSRPGNYALTEICGARSQTCANAWSRSARMSSICSIPIDSRT